MLGLIKGTVRRLDAALYKYNVVTGLYVLDTWERLCFHSLTLAILFLVLFSTQFVLFRIYDLVVEALAAQ